MTSCDAIIIGGGHNGLVVAAMLARAGRKVVLVEAGPEFGGATRATAFAPGFSSGGLAHLVNRFDDRVAKAIGLSPAALTGPVVSTTVIGSDRGPVRLHGGWGERVEGVAPEEAARFAAMRSVLLDQAAILGRFIGRPPPRPGAIGPGDMLHLGLTGLKLMGKGRQAARDFGRMMLMNVADVVEEYLTDERLMGLAAFDATLGIHLGPRSPTSLLGLCYRLTGSVSGQTGAQAMAAGGMAHLASQLAAQATKAGADLRTGQAVTGILTDAGRAIGVMTSSGEIIRSATIVSAIHPVTTMRGLLPRGEIDTGLDRSLRHVRSDGDAAKLHLALDRLPEFTGLTAADLAGRLVLARSVAHVENAFNPAKYGAFSPDPVMEITIPSLADPSLAPKGGAVLSAIVQYAPYRLKDGWERGRPEFLAVIMASLERVAPGISGLVRSSELLVPPDIEALYGMPGGHWHHGELQVDQMLMNRPAFDVSGHRTPVEGLWLASAGSHPGGGLSGLPGYNAARLILSRRAA